MKQILIWNVGKVHQWTRALPKNLAFVTLFVGDRLSCVDEGVALEVDGEVVGLATIAPKGEMMSEEPTIVALYVRHEFRRHGYGRDLMIAAIDRCRERGLVPVRVDLLSTPAQKIVENLPEEYRQDLRVFDMTLGGTTDLILLN
jgi:GNAT superfamily N-acetyltransferase